MQFDKKKQTLQLLPSEQDALGLRAPRKEWKVEEAPLLVEVAERARNYFSALDPSDYGPGPEQTAVRYRQRAGLALVTGIMLDVVPYASPAKDAEAFLRDLGKG